MVQHRKKLGKNQRVRRREKRCRDAQAAAEAGAKLSAMNTYFPSSVSEAAKAFGVSNNEQSDGLNIAMENQKVSFSPIDAHSRHKLTATSQRPKKPKQKITRGQFDDHHRRLKLLELHVEAAANTFNKIQSNHEVLSDHITRDLRNLIRNFSAACADGRAIRSTVDDAMAGVKSLETTVRNLEASMENLEASLEDLTAEMAPTRNAFDDAVKTMEERISAIESQVEQLVKGVSTSAAQQSASQPRDHGDRKVWQGRLRSGRKG
ncbi:hypothetical protein CKAH01_18487 [Colletotrichum kahawae]|uniref:Uncharacterized protein n=1 Tax=Colletotrichum kahawae TaxID=34407 RepID=A0AAE0D1Y6_COLKA|nr:hypothetical protein CKAH01_18487 [Colletotrichum kahawae]